jgi:hypothetical protein
MTKRGTGIASRFMALALTTKHFTPYRICRTHALLLQYKPLFEAAYWAAR